MHRARTTTAVVALLCLCACTSKSSAGAEVAAPSRIVLSVQPEAVTADLPRATDAVRAYMALQPLLHLADVERRGLYIHFGTPARIKYTLGPWKTGWGRDGIDNGAAYTEVAAASARLYLPLSRAGAQTLHLRLKTFGAPSVQPVLNGEPLAALALEDQREFVDYEVKIPAGVAQVGENQLLLRFGEFERSAEDQPYAALASLELSDGSAVSHVNMPWRAPAIRDLTVAGYTRKAIELTAPTTLSFYVDVPQAAKLSMRVASHDRAMQVGVRITPEGGQPVELGRSEARDAWLVQQLPLDGYAGRVVKLELSALGQGSVGIAEPTILAPNPHAARVSTMPKSAIVLLVDTLRADRVHAYNADTRVQTPALDAIAAQGALFESAQSPENWTKPAVASVLTGLYPSSHGTKASDARLSDDAVLVSEPLARAGFTTAAFVANGYVSERFGFNQGWGRFTNYIREHKSANAEAVFRDAARWIAAHRHERFFVYIQTIDPHVPYDPPDDILQLYQTEPYTGPIRPRQTADQLERAKLSPPKLKLDDSDRSYLEALYDGEVTFHDRALERFIERLKRLGVYDDVLFVVTADHGEEFYDHKSWGHGHTVYQELIGVPLLMRHPASIRPQRVAQVASTVDVAPTVLSALGVPVPDAMEGVDRMLQLSGAAPPGLSAAFSEFLDDRRVVRAGRWKLILRGLVPTLFDLQTDPHEQTELDLRAHPIALRYCRILLGQFLGARDRGDFLNAEPASRSVSLRGEVADIDDVTKGGLRALGYVN